MGLVARVGSLTWSDEIRIFAVDDPSNEPGRCPAATAAASCVAGTADLELLVLTTGNQLSSQVAGLRLIEALADRCRAEGLRRIVARPEDPTLHELLEACGFQRLEQVPVLPANASEAVTWDRYFAYVL